MQRPVGYYTGQATWCPFGRCFFCRRPWRRTIPPRIGACTIIGFWHHHILPRSHEGLLGFKWQLFYQPSDTREPINTLTRDQRVESGLHRARRRARIVSGVQRVWQKLRSKYRRTVSRLGGCFYSRFPRGLQQRLIHRRKCKVLPYCEFQICGIIGGQTMGEGE